MARFFREDFDREREFVVTRPHTVNGKHRAVGSEVDKAQYTVRRLRQLYDQRWVDFAPAKAAPEPLNPIVEAALASVTPPAASVPRRVPKAAVERKRPQKAA